MQPSISFVGAGKVGCTLGRYFQSCGFPVYGYCSRTPEAAKTGAGLTGSRVLTLTEVAAGSDLIFLTVPDSQLFPVWDRLRELPLAGKEICHCSGLYSSQVFAGMEMTGAKGFSLHPFFAVADCRDDIERMSQVYFTWEGAAEGTFLETLLCGIGNPVERIAPEHKPLYHAAAVFYSNLVVGLTQSASGLLKSCGLSADFAEHAWRSLFLGNALNIAANGLEKALTGPIERGDAATVAQHLNCLPDAARELYRLLSREVLTVAGQKHQGRDYTKIEEVLENEKYNCNVSAAESNRR